MNIEVRYYSKSGNTKKVATAIAKQAGVPAKSIHEPIQGKVDILFLGTGIYAFDIDPELKEYISTLHPENIKTVVVFSTAAIVRSAYEKTKRYLQEQGLSVSEHEYHCPGHYMFLRTGRPNSDDLKKAAQFAESCLHT
ncbi:MAG: flavodoxin family protein [Clostridium sp.]|uniref:flavodoxin family protein n=1 Tax=Clostridium sp. TaxID=1506 RepID=UPI00290FADA3|nr:flavodoxin family protein [Clostridium sp.]MDU7336615.1 flavodoxin family protein [Clostridium sp.]